MSDFNVHARVVYQPDTTIKGRIAASTGSMGGGNKKIVQLVGKYAENEVFSKNIGKGKVAANQKEFQKMMNNPKLIPIPLKEIKNKKEAGNLQPNEVVFIKVDDAAKLGLKLYSMKSIQKALSDQGTGSDMKLMQVKTHITKAFLTEGNQAFYSLLKNSLVSKWDQPIDPSTLQKAENFMSKNPQVKLTPEQRESLIYSRTGGSYTIMDNPSKKQDWLNAEEFVRNKAEKGEDLTIDDLCKLNAFVNGVVNTNIGGGDFRDHIITVGGSGGPGYPHNDDVEPLMKGLIKEINDGIAKGENPIVLSAKAYQKMVSIHPFTDGNGRTCRLVMDYVLLRAGLPPPSLGKNVNIAIFGEQDCKYQPKVETPTSAVEMIIKGLMETYETINK